MKMQVCMGKLRTGVLTMLSLSPALQDSFAWHTNICTPTQPNREEFKLCKEHMAEFTYLLLIC